MSDRRGPRHRGEIVYSYTEGTLVRSRDIENDRYYRLREPKERDNKRIVVRRQNKRSVYRDDHREEPGVRTERRIIRSVSNPTYMSQPIRYIVRRPAQSTSSYYSRTGSGSSSTTGTGSSYSYSTTSETSSTYTPTDSVSGYDYDRPVTIRRRFRRRRPQSAESVEGYDARQFRSQEPGSWRIIRTQPESRFIEREENVVRTVESEEPPTRTVIETVRRSPMQEEDLGEPEEIVTRTVLRPLRRSPIQEREQEESFSESQEDTDTTDTLSDRAKIEHGYQDRMREYRYQKSRDVATQMITHFVAPPEEPKEEIITCDADTQTAADEPRRPSKLHKDRYKTAIVPAEPLQRESYTDDEIEIVVLKDPVLTTEVVREPEPPPPPPPVLVEEIDLRPPPPEQAPVKDFGPKRKFVPPPRVSQTSSTFLSIDKSIINYM